MEYINVGTDGVMPLNLNDDDESRSSISRNVSDYSNITQLQIPLEITPSDALIVVDMQNDFVDPNGSLYVPYAEKLIPGINKILESNIFTIRVATQDWHTANHCSFKENGGIWPAHCVQGSKGAELVKELNSSAFTHIVHKGTREILDSYSAFTDDGGMPTDLNAYLHNMKTNRVFICGVALEYCVYCTVLDALKSQFTVYLLNDLSAPVTESNVEECMKKMKSAGAFVITSSDITM